MVVTQVGANNFDIETELFFERIGDIAVPSFTSAARLELYGSIKKDFHNFIFLKFGSVRSQSA